MQFDLLHSRSVRGPLRSRRTGILLFLFLLILTYTGLSFGYSKSTSRVYLNGVPTPVYFNDGDSFRVLSGPFAGTKARLKGYNTLESYGAVHQWGTWTRKELYVLAKEATLVARKGIWHCTSDLKKDGYGRILWDCPDVALELVSRGLAHALTITRHPADAKLLEAQHEAMRKGLGIWAHGIPRYILTSTHSYAERNGQFKPYNRLISSRDGHSEKWYHENTYAECEDVCLMARNPTDDWIADAVSSLRTLEKEDEDMEWLSSHDDAALAEIVTDLMHLGFSYRLREDPHAEDLSARLEAFMQDGTLEPLERTKDSCMIYVDFRRRFGRNRAACL